VGRFIGLYSLLSAWITLSKLAAPFEGHLSPRLMGRLCCIAVLHAKTLSCIRTFMSAIPRAACVDLDVVLLALRRARWPLSRAPRWLTSQSVCRRRGVAPANSSHSLLCGCHSRATGAEAASLSICTGAHSSAGAGLTLAQSGHGDLNRGRTLEKWSMSETDPVMCP
jgi:hypothetical protein